MRYFPKRRRGQGMTEYIIIVAVVAILSIGIVVRFGDQIRDFFIASGENMAGESRAIENHLGNDDPSRTIQDLGN